MNETFAALAALGVLLTGAGSIYTAIRTGRTQRTVQATHVTVREIDRAVNGKPPGATTMVSQVQDLHDEQFPAPQTNGAAILPTLARMEEQLATLMKGKDTP